MNIVKFNEVNEKIITIQNEKVILDSDVAELYGVETKRINEAVKNNPEKFPKGYILQLSKQEWYSVRATLLSINNNKSDDYNDPVENFDQLGNRKHSSALPKAFSEKGLYMLATILKGEKAIATTIAIIEAFAQLRELQKTVAELSEATDEFQQKSLMQKGGEIIAELIGDNLHTSDSETSIELNFAVFKFKHTVKRKTN